MRPVGPRVQGIPSSADIQASQPERKKPRAWGGRSLRHPQAVLTTWQHKRLVPAGEALEGLPSGNPRDERPKPTARSSSGKILLLT